MAHKKTSQNIFKSLHLVPILIVCVVILFVILIYRYLFSISHKKNVDLSYTIINNESSQNKLGENFNQITPTIIPSQTNGKNIFIHPNNVYSFEYPNYWQLSLNQHYKNKEWYELSLFNSENQSRFRINFMVAGRGLPYFDYETNEQKVINGRTINWRVLYENDKAFEASVSFPNNDFGHNLIGLYIYLPEDNQEEFISQVEEIIASLNETNE